MKRFLFFTSLIIFSSSLCFGQVVSFNDIRSHYQVFLNEPNLENLRELSQELDLFSQSDFILSKKKKYAGLNSSFSSLNENVKKTLSSFDNPWITETSDSEVDPNLTLISDSFIDFVIQQNILVSRSSTEMQFTIIGTAVLFLICLLAFFMISKHKREKQNALLQSKYMMQGQEAERRRISEELHDTIAQNLKAQKLQILNAKDNLPGPDYEKSGQLLSEWDSLYESSKENLKGIREICQNLFPPNFTSQNIEWIIAELCQKTESKTGIKCIYSFSEDSAYENIPDEYKLHIFRILQEGINNSVTHGNCSEIKIIFSKNEITLSDNGCGFDYGFNIDEIIAKKTNHFGLRSIQERARIINARCDIASNKNGTCITLQFK